MKIVNNRTIERTLPFGIFPLNQVFEYKRCFYLKIDEVSNYCNAVDLYRGRAVTLCNNDLVVPVNAILTIEN